jgi:DNA-binding XRE family transcriptional regulator
LGGRVRIDGELLSHRRRATTSDGAEFDYYLVRLRGVSQPVAVHAEDVSDAELLKYQLTDVDFDDTRSQIAKNIRRYRHRSNMSQYELAEAVGVSQNAVSQWETDVCTPRFYVVPRLTKVLGITIEDLYGVND